MVSENRVCPNWVPASELLMTPTGYKNQLGTIFASLN
ncbi:Uncharacterised protein [Vibrio cholerae]|nr:Uncharacterised protein [Vibrio cholerae]